MWTKARLKVLNRISEVICVMCLLQTDMCHTAKIGQTILNTDGVDDYSNLKINSKTENIAISETEIAVLGGVAVG